MHNQRLHTTETREELYQPVKTRPSETFHARMLMGWSMSAGTLIFFILVLGSALGLEYPAPRPPLVDDHHLTGLGYRHRHPLPNRWSRVRLPSISACYPLRPQIADRRHVYSGCECSPRRRGRYHDPVGDPQPGATLPFCPG